MPQIDLSILNQRQTPAFYADVLANRPAAGFIGRIFVSTDTFAFFRDNGTGWDLIGGPGTGTITGSGATGQIALWDGASTITGDTGLTYNGTDNSLTASKFIVTGGTSSQFLKADGSVDSSSYVPYTGATASLNMGANNISGQNYFINGNGVNSGGYLGIKQYSGTSSGSLGYTSLYAALQNSLYIQYSQTDSTIKTVELSSGLLGTTPRQYQFPDADGTFALTSNLSAYVPYTGANANVNLGAFDLTADLITGATGSFTSSGGSNTFGITHSSGSGIALNISKDGNGEGLFVTKGSGSGNAAKIVGGKSVFENSGGDSHIQIVGATAPSLRIDNLETGATNRIGIGLSTAVNNFIQGSTGGEYCIFNSSTTASPILFGIYDAGLTNTQEAARISPARNFLIGTTTDSGQKLIVNGTSKFTGVLTSNTYIAFDTTSSNFSIQGTVGWNDIRGTVLTGKTATTYDLALYSASGGALLVNPTGTNGLAFIGGNNFLIGTTTDAGQKLQVNGSGGIYITTPTTAGTEIGLTIQNVSSTSSGVQQKFKNGFGDLAGIKASQIDNGAGADNGQLELQTAVDSVLATQITISDNGNIKLHNLPTSSAGLGPGQLWNNLGIVNIT
jgi:hypothetical protein